MQYPTRVADILSGKQEKSRPNSQVRDYYNDAVGSSSVWFVDWKDAEA
jgi:hypothetical protein